MSNLYHTLDEILVRKISLYNEIIAVMKEEWDSMTQYSRVKLEDALQRKEGLLAQVHDLNYQREEIVKTFAKNMNKPQSQVTLKTIITLKDNLWGKRMAAHRETIRKQIETIHELNLANKNLIARSSLAMKKSMSWLYEVDTEYTPYYANGRLREPVMESRVVNTDV